MKLLQPTKKELSGLKGTINIAIQGSEYFSEESPKWLRPLTKIIAFTIILLFMFLMFPFILIKRKHPNSYQKLKTELVAIWHSESSTAALKKLRNIHGQLINDFQKVMLGGHKIEPYGKFNFYDYANVAELLYHWEIQHRNFDEALKICEEMLVPGKESKNRSKSNAYWIIKKAKTINLLNGEISAQEYLLKHIDPDNKQCKVKEYLHELRKESSV